jgi:hypothetical protein
VLLTRSAAGRHASREGRRGQGALPARSVDQPQQESGDDDGRTIVDRPLLVASGDGAPLLELVDTPLHDVALLVPLGIEVERSSGPGRRRPGWRRWPGRRRTGSGPSRRAPPREQGGGLLQDPPLLLRPGVLTPAPGQLGAPRRRPALAAAGVDAGRIGPQPRRLGVDARAARDPGAQPAARAHELDGAGAAFRVVGWARRLAHDRVPSLRETHHPDDSGVHEIGRGPPSQTRRRRPRRRRGDTRWVE